jgi:hypothetical protein
MKFDKQHTPMSTETIALEVAAPESSAQVEAPVKIETPTPAAGEPGGGLKILRKGNEVFDEAPQTPEPAAAPEVSNGLGNDPAGVIAPETPESKVPAEDEIEFFPYAAEVTEGAIKTPDDVFNLYKENTDLKKKLAEKPIIEFPNPEAEAAYKYAIKFPGREVAAVNGFYKVLSLGDISKLPPKEAQFEAFLLKQKHVTREKARDYFDAKYELSYGGGKLEDDPIAQFDHDTETQNARESLLNLQSEVDQYKPSQPAGNNNQQPVVSEADIASARAGAKKALENFGGVKYQFIDNEPNSLVSIPMEDSEAQQLEDWMSNPKTFLDDLTAMCKDDKGNFSPDKLSLIMFEIKNSGRIREQAFDAGKKLGKLEYIKEKKNSATPRVTPETAAPRTGPASLAEAMVTNIRPRK